MRVFIIGDGLQLPHLIDTFHTKGHEITVIHIDRDYCKELARKFDVTIIHGDGTNPRVLDDAGIEFADIVIAITPNDHDNFLICEIAQKIYSIEKSLAVVYNPKNIDVFHRLGVKNVISMTEMISSFIEQKMDLDNVTELYTNDDENILVLEVDIRKGYRSIGMKVSKIGLPRDSLISCIIRAEGAIIPKADTEIRVGDRLITYSLHEVEKDLVKALKG